MNLIPPLLKALQDVGYESSTPIQAKTIPLLLAGRDVIGQAQTGTGKTAAFALPLLSLLDLARKSPQIMVLAPTRELAIQVAEAFQTYARHLQGFHVLPIYGGQSYEIQLRQLKRGVHVVVGTPGRIMDHMRRGTLKLGELHALVLDEADEMLRMGFIDDVQWILEQTPDNRQIALFSATMPPVIRKIAEQHLNNPEHVTIKVQQATAETIRQRYWMVSGRHKLDALTRILEAEPFEAVLIFVRTKVSTEELAEKLEARGYAATALNGDIAQKQRELTVNRLRKGHLDILVATDVAARGLDVSRISHVINYDIPHDTESYIHRIGRTGRAGRAGDAILFVAPREKRMLYAIERATRKQIDEFVMPTTESINDKRIAEFKKRITDALESDEGTGIFTEIIEQYHQEHNIPTGEIAAALARMVQGDKPLLLQDEPRRKPARDRQNPRFDAPEDKRRSIRKRERHQYEPGEFKSNRKPGRERPDRSAGTGPQLEQGMVRYRLEVGETHDVKAGNIVGAIANELGIESEFINHVQIRDDHSTVDLPEGMPRAIFREMKEIWVCGQRLNASVLGGESASGKPKRTLGGAGGSRRPDHKPGRKRLAAGDGRRPPKRKNR